MNGTNAIILASDANYMFATANVIIGVEKHSPNLVDKYIIYTTKENGVSDIDRKAIALISDKVEFRNFELPIGSNREFLDSHPGKYNELIYAKFLIFDLLEEFDRVLWLDSDLLVQGDISEIFKSKSIAWRPTVSKLKDRVKMEGFDFSENETTPNCGVVYVTRDSKTEQIQSKDVFSLFNDICNAECIFGPDENTFGVLAHKYALEVNLLDDKYNSNIDMKNNDEAIILHAYTYYWHTDKFWNNMPFNCIFKEWRENNDVWIKCGGTPYKGKIKSEHIFGGGYTNKRQFCDVGKMDKLLA